MPSIAVTRPYEAIYIVDPDLGEEQVSAITDRYKQLVETNGGTVGKIDVWERRKLAYEIKGRTEGIYVVMQFMGEAKVEAELRRIFQISEDQLRAMIVRPEEAAPEAAPAEAAPAAPPRAVAPTPIAAPAAEPTAPAEPDSAAAPAAEPTAPVAQAQAPVEEAPEAAPAPIAEPEAAAAAA